jgi:hypothetical protein
MGIGQPDLGAAILIKGGQMSPAIALLGGNCAYAPGTLQAWSSGSGFRSGQFFRNYCQGAAFPRGAGAHLLRH